MSPASSSALNIPSRIILLVGICLGCALRLWQYLFNPSLWVDEAALARNVLSKGFLELLGPLDFAQTAAPGFLLLVKISTVLFGSSEYALRLVPLLAGVASPLVFYFLARLVVSNLSASAATFLFSLGSSFVFFSAHLKQYSVDVLCSMAGILIAHSALRAKLSTKSCVAFAFASIPLVACSQPAVFVVLGGSLALAVRGIPVASHRKQYLAIALMWSAISFLSIANAHSIMPELDALYMNKFWQARFAPEAGLLPWSWKALVSAFGDYPGLEGLNGSLHLVFAELWAALSVLGLLSLAWRRPMLFVLVVTPVFLTLLASVAHLFPFGSRAGMFLVPLYLLCLCVGIECAGRLLGSQRKHFANLLLIPLAVQATLDLHPPASPEHLRPIVRYLSMTMQESDSLWVYYGAGQAFEYYSKLHPVKGSIRVSTCNRDEPRNYLRELDLNRGKTRLWVLFAHSAGSFQFDERGMIMSYLRTIGRVLGRIEPSKEDNPALQAEAYLFDLSDPAKLAQASSDDFPIAKLPSSEVWSCYGTMAPLEVNQRAIDSLLATNPK